MIFTFIWVIILCVLCVFVILYYFCLINVDTSEFFRYISNLSTEFMNKNLINLLNANPISNLPKINLITTNQEITNIEEKCSKGAVFMGTDSEADYTQKCFNSCGSTGRILKIATGDEMYLNGILLTKGFWCSIRETNCNLRTTYIVASINGVVCKSKYPNMFGGEEGNLITACSDEITPQGTNQLWDYLNNEIVDPSLIDMSNEDEQLSDGTFRFRCKPGADLYGNLYIEHPLNRFHLIRNVCNKTVVAANENVLLIDDDNDNWHCDCGDFDATRVRHENPDDNQSTCTSCYYSNTNHDYTIPIKCFRTMSDYTKFSESLFPCLDGKYTQVGSECNHLNINLNTVMQVTENISFTAQNTSIDGQQL